MCPRASEPHGKKRLKLLQHPFWKSNIVRNSMIFFDGLGKTGWQARPPRIKSYVPHKKG